MRLALAQIDPLIGDFAGTCAKICQFIERARQQSCDLVVFPEMALLGYPPRDLLDKSGFVAESQRYWQTIREASRGIGVICGVVSDNESQQGKPYHNTALFFADGAIIAKAHKQLLPSYDVFDEGRYFEPGTESAWVDYKGERLGFTVCEDVWNRSDSLPHFPYRCDPVADLAQASVSLLINISASPYHVKKIPLVQELLGSHARKCHCRVVYVNQVGGNDELIFQGHSMVLDESGQVVACAADFQEDLVVYDTSSRIGDCHAVDVDPTDELVAALVLGLRDYARKCSFEQVVLGLSGGVDSALVACLATLALGPDQVLGVGLPGPYNAPESLADARELAHRLGILFEVVPIGDLFNTALQSLKPVFGNLPADVTEENLQARIRGMLLMALSNKFNRLLLSTGNKSEIAVGYCTLYGDMNGGLAVLGDVPKTTVFALAHHLNAKYGWIPERILTRPPSAELRPDQTDADSLPPYPVLDGILAAYVEQRCSAREIVALGYDRELVEWVVRKVDGNEYKRWQAPPVLRISAKAFGTGRRYPIAHA
jgi:NAD+ synthase (glutamine-hydrolysing)